MLWWHVVGRFFIFLSKFYGSDDSICTFFEVCDSIFWVVCLCLFYGQHRLAQKRRVRYAHCQKDFLHFFVDLKTCKDLVIFFVFFVFWNLICFRMCLFIGKTRLSHFICYVLCFCQQTVKDDRYFHTWGSVMFFTSEVHQPSLHPRRTVLYCLFGDRLVVMGSFCH